MTPNTPQKQAPKRQQSSKAGQTEQAEQANRKFDYTLDFAATDFRQHPELYRVGRGEQGVLLVQPYKQELLPLWRFRTPQIATESADALVARFEAYKAAGDFVGMDMARKFLQMGYTRSRRYANHRTGKKYDGPVPVEHRGESGSWGRETLARDPDPVKAESAQIFKERWDTIEADPVYCAARQTHKAKYG